MILKEEDFYCKCVFKEFVVIEEEESSVHLVISSYNPPTTDGGAEAGCLEIISHLQALRLT